MNNILKLNEGITIAKGNYDTFELNHNAVLIIPPSYSIHFSVYLWDPDCKVYILNQKIKLFVAAYNGSFVYSLGNSEIYLYAYSKALAYNSNVFVYNDSSAFVRNCKCFTVDNSCLYAFKDSEIYVTTNKPTVYLYDNTYIRWFDGKPKIKDNRKNLYPENKEV